MNCEETESKLKVAIIGLGGTGSWLAELLVRSFKTHIKELHLIDGDTLEEANFDRQNFPVAHCIGGVNKACSTRTQLGFLNRNKIEKIQEHERFFQNDPSFDELKDCDLIFCCPDNHACRLEVLDFCDKHQIPRTIITGNEEIDSSAYFYSPNFKDTPHDPRVLYPEMLEPKPEQDPTSCVYAAESFPQICLANANSATQALYLFYLYFIKGFDEEQKRFLPIEIGQRPFGPTIKRILDLE